MLMYIMVRHAPVVLVASLPCSYTCKFCCDFWRDFIPLMDVNELSTHKYSGEEACTSHICCEFTRLHLSGENRTEKTRSNRKSTKRSSSDLAIRLRILKNSATGFHVFP